jgi:hypothetical protein
LRKAGLRDGVLRMAMGWDGMGLHVPAVWEVGAYLFEEGVAHVVDGEDEAVLVGVQAFLDAGEELEG